MDEVQGIITFLAGLTSIALVIEALKATIWAVIVAVVFRRLGIVVRVEGRRPQRTPTVKKGTSSSKGSGASRVRWSV